MLAEYWDEANLGLLAIEGMKEGLGFHQEMKGLWSSGGSAYCIHQWRSVWTPSKKESESEHIEEVSPFSGDISFLHGFIFNFTRGLFFEALFWCVVLSAVVHVSWCSIAIAGVHPRPWHHWYLAMDLTRDLGWAKGYLEWRPWTITMLGHDKLYWAMSSQAWCLMHPTRIHPGALKCFLNFKHWFRDLFLFSNAFIRNIQICILYFLKWCLRTFIANHAVLIVSMTWAKVSLINFWRLC